MRIIISEIVSGTRAPGDMLPKEVDLATEFDVSRGVARETIRALEERDLISVRHGKGATVNDPSAWDVFDPNVLAATLESGRGADVLAEYLECRRILEVEAAGMAAARAKKRDVRRLTEALSRMEEAADHPAGTALEERFHQADIAFHQALVAATGNSPLAQLVERLQSAMLLARLSLAAPRYRQQALADHRRILEAVTSGDAAEARQAMSDYLDTLSGYLSRGPRQR
jgi:GntR family transcriptional repressor for pyruvate dehydrogenase complex